MDSHAIELQRAMQRAVSALHSAADDLVTYLEGTPILEEDSPAGDNARAALDGARAWRAVMESPVDR